MLNYAPQIQAGLCEEANGRRGNLLKRLIPTQGGGGQEIASLRPQ
jgi:hypothetical protein